ncbi:hypothetical protein GQ53DRAFT_32926 [Thozetella sp. PMI_491]|nr:hypothetical protein GQ53DRAFT_32926 [Thozetella sp. PMI_491]
MATPLPRFSSPRRMVQHDSLIVISSSPELPSLSDLLVKPPKKDPLRSGSNAAPIPEDAAQAFRSAASLYRSTVCQGDVSVDKTDSRATAVSPKRRGRPPANRTAPKTVIARVPAADELIEEEPQAPPPPRARGRKRKVKEIPAEEIPVKEMPATPEKPWLKFKASPEAKVHEQSALQSGDVATSPPTQGSNKAAELVSRHFQTNRRDAEVKTVTALQDPVELDAPLELEPAIKRRMDWTPSKDTTMHPCSDPSDIHEISSPYGATDRITGKPPSAPVPPEVEVEVLRKRKLVEMIVTSDTKAPADEPELSPSKPKAQKKKPKTITELATAAYRVADETLNEPAPLLDYLEVENDNPPAEEHGPKSKSKSTKKAATKSKAPRKKAELPKRLLLSPSSALKQSSKQDIIFGTSSQLAAEDDPILLRALHTAMQVSNTDPYSPFATSSPPESDLWARSGGGTKLWKASARDIDGTLLEVIDLADSPAVFLPPVANRPLVESQMTDPTSPRVGQVYHDGTLAGVEVLDLTDTPAVAKSLHILSQKATVHKTSAPDGREVVMMATSTVNANSKLESDKLARLYGSPDAKLAEVGVLDLTDTSAIAKSLDSLSQRQSTRLPAFNLQQTPGAVTTPPIDLPESDSEPPASNQELACMQYSQRYLSPKKPINAPAPNYELFTDAQLAKEIKSYGFKPVKRRSAMIELLNQCWASKNKTAVGRTTQEPQETSVARRKHMESPEPEAPSTRTRSRPRKDSVTASASTASVVAKAASPKRRRPRSTKSSTTGDASTVPTAQSPSPKRPRGRPRKEISPAPSGVAKDSASTLPPDIQQSRPLTVSTPKRGKAAKKVVIEIADSESEPSPMSSLEDAHVFSSPEAVDISIGDDTEISLAASPTSQEAQLFTFITKAVTSAPPTKDPQEPSWHEKMLMYDPIILEDFAAWLNAGQLDRVGHDGEVTPAEVKKWCESKRKSIKSYI